jgi:hypothetical protein
LCGNFILSDFCLSLFSFFLILSNIYCSTTSAAKIPLISRHP